MFASAFPYFEADAELGVHLHIFSSLDGLRPITPVLQDPIARESTGEEFFFIQSNTYHGDETKERRTERNIINYGRSQHQATDPEAITSAANVATNTIVN